MTKKTVISMLCMFFCTPVFSVFANEYYEQGHNDYRSDRYSGRHDRSNNHHRHQHPYRSDRYGLTFHEMLQIKSQLTPAQQANFDSITENFTDEINPILTKLAIKEAEYKALMLNQNPDVTKAGKLAGDISELQQELHEEQFKYYNNLETKFPGAFKIQNFR